MSRHKCLMDRIHYAIARQPCGVLAWCGPVLLPEAANGLVPVSFTRFRTLDDGGAVHEYGVGSSPIVIHFHPDTHRVHHASGPVNDHGGWQRALDPEHPVGASPHLPGEEF